jgi:hypothetical protein
MRSTPNSKLLMGLFMKFTLREMFLVVLVVALALGWSLDKTAYHRSFVAVDRLNGALYDELRSSSQSSTHQRQVRRSR